jgi:hypothetical protein
METLTKVEDRHRSSGATLDEQINLQQHQL